MKPSKFLLNPVRALNFLGGGRSWSGRGGGGGLSLALFTDFKWVVTEL